MNARARHFISRRSDLKFGVGILGLGRYLPKRKITNQTLAKKLRISPGLILERTGIENRFFAGPSETSAFMAFKAGRQALNRAGVKPNDIDLIMGCTSSGNYRFPAMACKVQDLLEARHAGAFDLAASASGFPIAVAAAADRLCCDSEVKNILVVGVAAQSPYINWKDPKIAPLLGDGSGAALIARVPKGFGVLTHVLLSRGDIYDAARLREGGHIEMDGVVMGRAFLKDQPILIAKALKKAGVRLSDANLFIFHQANLRLIQFLMERLHLPMSRTFTNVAKVGNTADASIPIALCEAQEQGKIRRGDVVVLSGLGAGCILSVTVLRWY